jgi:hypothetical protein
MKMVRDEYSAEDESSTPLSPSGPGTGASTPSEARDQLVRLPSETDFRRQRKPTLLGHQLAVSSSMYNLLGDRGKQLLDLTKTRTDILFPITRH